MQNGLQTMSKINSTTTVILAFSVNLLIAITKFFIWGITGSSAFFSEGVHSLVDTANQSMLWYGQIKSSKGPDTQYPLGRGREEYFWGLVVAVVFFTLGGVVSVQHGVEALIHPRKLDNLSISIWVLIISIILESYVLVRATKELRRNSVEKKSVYKLLKESSEGSLIAIVVEDLAATLGLVIALIGVTASYLTGNSMFDGLSSIFIGLLLMISGLFLGYEMKHLIVGESVDTKTRDRICNLIKVNELVKEVTYLEVVIIGSNKYLVVGDIDYLDDLSDEIIGNVNKKIIKELKTKETRIVQVFLNTV